MTTTMVANGTGLQARPISRTDRLRAKVRSRSLDDELARGLEPERRWLRAVRASMLVASRSDLADDWESLLGQARSGMRRRGVNAVPIRDRALRDADTVIEDLVRALRTGGPVDVRGLATAHRLLTDGTGPVYRARSPEHLAAAVAEAIRRLRIGPPAVLDAGVTRRQGAQDERLRTSSRR